MAGGHLYAQRVEPVRIARVQEVLVDEVGDQFLVGSQVMPAFAPATLKREFRVVQ